LLSINAYILARNFEIDDYLNIVVRYEKSCEEGVRGKTVNAETIQLVLWVNLLMLYG